MDKKDRMFSSAGLAMRVRGQAVGIDYNELCNSVLIKSIPLFSC